MGLNPAYLAPVGFAALAVAMTLATQRPDAADARPGLIDRPVPAFVQPPLAKGEAGFASAELNGRVTILHVFASWCSTCRAEHPTLMQLAADPGTPPIYGLNWKDDKGAGRLYLNQFGNPYAATAEDRDGILGNELRVTGVPETFVIDASGRLRYRHIGPVTPAIWSETLAPLIAELEAGT